MEINLIAIGTKMADWVETASKEYQKRLPYDYRLNVIEIPAIARHKNSDLAKIKIDEGKLLLNKVPTNNDIIALDEHGKLQTTTQLADTLKKQHDDNRSISLLIGGAEGLSQEVLQKVNQTWSLSPLTFPHPLVRIIIAEQLYRAWTIIQGHPYHRS